MQPVAVAGNRSFLLLFVFFLINCADRHRPSAQELLRDSERKQELGEIDAALKIAELGATSSTDPVLQALFHLRQAELLQSRGKTDEALSHIPGQLPSGSEPACRAQMLRGWANFGKGKLAVARSLLNDAYNCGTALQNARLVGRIEIRRAAVFTELSEPELAEESIIHAIEISDQTRDDFLMATALGNLGMMRLSASRFDEAIPFLEKSMETGERIGARGSQAVNFLNLGVCHYRLGDLDKALDMFSRARVMLQTMGRFGHLQMVLGHIGNVYLSRKDYKTAQAYYAEALELARKIGDPVWISNWSSNIATVLIKSGDYTAAETYNNDALAVWTKLQPSDSKRWPELNAGAIAMARRDFKGAIERYTDIINVEPHSPGQILEAYSGLGRVYVATGELDKAESQFQKTTTTIEQFREKLSKDDYKLTYLSSLMNFYQEYVQLLMSQGKHEKALRVVEASRARILSAHLGNQERVRVADAARESGATVLTFWLAPRKSYIWVLNPGKTTAIPLRGEEVITPLVEKHSNMIQGLRDPLQSGSTLFDMLLGEASKLIPKNARVIVMPDGALNSLNFETLPVSSPSPHYWIEDVTLSLAPSLAVLTARTKTAAPNRTVLLIGDPTLAAEAGPPLPFAAREIEVIRQRVSSSEPTIFTRTAATPDAYKQAGGFRLIHFASHATANRESPLDSAVLLSGNKLYVRDIMKVPLSADLVTVSACRSAGARTYGGEGLVGFAWAFLQSGAKNVVAGLWDVNDASTARLMGDMYAELEQGRPVSEALRTAKLHMIQSDGAYKKPYYWAPFQVYTRTGGRSTSK
jgi:CHAT domain-containing protein/Tfp pilus assembly protein PilF